MRIRSLSFCLALAAPFALVGPAAAQEEQFGTVKTFEATADGGVLVLAGGVHFGVPKAVYEAHRETLNGLREGSSVAYVLDRSGALQKIREVAREEDGSRQRVYSGKLVKVEKIGDMWWLFMDEHRWPIPLEVYTKSELPFMKRGNPLRVVVEKGRVVEVARGVLSEDTLKPEHWDRIQRSHRNDDVFVNGRAYKFVDSDLQAIKVSPKLPDGSHLGVETIKLEDIKSFQNPAADARAGGGGTSGGASGGDALDQTDVRLGDTLGLGLDSGQVVTLDEEVCELRVWRNETWGPVRTWKRAELTGPVRRVSLSSQTTTAVEGGEVRLRVHRSRHATKSGLVFEVEVDHDLKDKVMVGARVKFHLGGLAMSPGSPGEKVEEEPVPVLFAGQQARLVHRVTDDGLMDGWAEVHLGEGAVVPLASPGAKAHLIAAICAETADLNELTRVYEAAGGNGDEDLLRILVERTLYPPSGPIDQPKHAEAALAGLERAGQKAARLIVGDLFYLDRNLKRASLQRSGELIYEPLNRMDTEPAAYKQQLILLLGRLPGALRGELGQRVFSLYMDREDLNEAIQRAFSARPAEAMETLLEVATSTHSGSTPEEVRRAEAAAALLRRLGDAVLEEMLGELRKRDISVVELQAQRQKPGVTPGEMVDRALALLVSDAGRRRRALLDQRVTVAVDLEGQEKWAEALEVLREVLRQDKGHEGALEHLPVVLVNLARVRRAEARGEAALLLEEAAQVLPPARKMLAHAPLAELYLEAAREDAQGISIRARPHPGGARLRMANPGEGFPGKVVDTEWVELEMGEKKGYVRLSAVRETGPGQWSVMEGESPLAMIEPQLNRVRSLSTALEAQANQVQGELLARDALAHYEAGDFHGALPLFEQARALAPTDPRLSHERSAWMKAHLAYLLAVGAVVLVGLGVGVMQLFSRPRKIKFSGEFRHYGANRSARERDLDLGEEGAAPPADGAAS